MSSFPPSRRSDGHDSTVSDFDLPGSLRRIRRRADLSQRELAGRIGLSKSALAAAEAGTRDLPATALSRAATLAGLRLALLDGSGCEVIGMLPGGARDAAHRRLPAHLDTIHTDEVASRWTHNHGRARPWFTFTLDRDSRDRSRRRAGTPEDHHVPLPGDSPQERQLARRRAAWVRREEERRRRWEAGELPRPQEWECTCPPRCEELDDRSGRPVHAADCPCSCDVG
jgi:transcriptional regulator with XRE-family HTH domain